MKRWSWLMAWVLGLAMMVCVGCEDDGDDDAESGTTSTVVTNIVNGTTVVVTNVTPSGTSGGGTSGGGTSGGGTSGGTTPPPAATPLMAPTLVYPDDGAVFQGGVVDTGYYVELMWSTAEGAQGFVVDINGTQYAYTGGTFGIELNWGEYTWSVTSVGADPATERATSSSRTFSIVFTPGVPLL